MSDLRGLERCESPIEVMLGEAFAGIGRWLPRAEDDEPHEVGTWPGWAMVLLAQIRLDRYRADFSITTSRGLDTRGSWIVVVEVDGHDFHERTKEQARRDRSRDRFMVEHDIRVLRFTGSEIYADAHACALQAWSVASRLQGKVFDDDFAEWLLERSKSA